MTSPGFAKKWDNPICISLWLWMFLKPGRHRKASVICFESWIGNSLDWPPTRLRIFLENLLWLNFHWGFNYSVIVSLYVHGAGVHKSVRIWLQFSFNYVVKFIKLYEKWEKEKSQCSYIIRCHWHAALWIFVYLQKYCRLRIGFVVPSTSPITATPPEWKYEREKMRIFIQTLQNAELHCDTYSSN